VKKLLLASALAIASFPGYAAEHAQTALERECVEQSGQDGELIETEDQRARYNECLRQGRARVTITPPYQGPPPIGWIYGPYTQCANPPQCSMGVVNVQADGLNVRVVPDGPPVMSLVNGVPFYPLQRQGDWLLVASSV
jgi:hypothetical protein